MTYTVVIFKASGEVFSQTQPKKPDYKQMSAAVGGYIQEIPHFARYGDHTRGTCMANEEGIILGLPFNDKATKAWRANLGPGPFLFSEPPKLFGDVIYWART